MRRRLVLSLLVVSAVAAAAGPAGVAAPGKSRLASFVSRDARLFLRVDDRHAFLRRARRTDISRALAGPQATFARESLLRLTSDLTLFLPPVVIDAVPAILGRGEGEVALSVEGFTLERGEPYPDVLLLADLSGFEGVVSRLRAAAHGAMDVRSVVSEFALPFDAVERPDLLMHRGIDLVRLTTSAGAPIVLAEHRGLLLGAGRPEPIRAAIDRMDDPHFGALADDPAFARCWNELDPAPGSLFAYSNLRLLRREEAFLRAEEIVLRELFVRDLDDYDALALHVRGVGDQFELRGWLDVGKGKGPARPLFGGDAPFRAPRVVDGEVTASLSFRLDGVRIGRLLAALNPALGGLLDADRLATRFDEIVNIRERIELASLLGGEVMLLHTRNMVGRIPTTLVLVETRDPAALRQLLDRIAERSPQVQATDAPAGRTWSLSLRLNMHLSRPAFGVVDRWLVGGANAVALHALRQGAAAGEERLARTEAYLAPFDRLDLGVDGPRTTTLFLDTPHLGPVASVWLQSVAPRVRVAADAMETAEFLNDLLQLWDDPEVHEALHGTVAVTRSRPAGVRIDAVGP
ncbi:MAG: hypothetical protein ACF8XB_20075 [Planctomycetota bacterium JB042]